MEQIESMASLMGGSVVIKVLKNLNLFLVPWVAGWTSGLGAAAVTDGQGPFLLAAGMAYTGLALALHALSLSRGY